MLPLQHFSSHLLGRSIRPPLFCARRRAGSWSYPPRPAAAAEIRPLTCAGAWRPSCSTTMTDPPRPAMRKATSRRTDDGMPVHSFRSLLADLATLALNKVSLPSNPKYRFDLPTEPTLLQAAPSTCSASDRQCSQCETTHRPSSSRINGLFGRAMKTSV